MGDPHVWTELPVGLVRKAMPVNCDVSETGIKTAVSWYFTTFGTNPYVLIVGIEGAEWLADSYVEEILKGVGLACVYGKTITDGSWAVFGKEGYVYSEGICSI